MAEYIKRRDALNAIERSCWTEIAYDLVEELPAADVVEVVRCKDCKHSTPCEEIIRCLNPYGLTICDENDFCSYGERRHENDSDSE